MMQGKIEKFNKELTWNTKIFVLLSVLLITFSYVFNAPESGYTLPVITSLLVLMFVELLLHAYYKHPALWHVIKWVILFLAMGLILMGLNT